MDADGERSRRRRLPDEGVVGLAETDGPPDPTDDVIALTETDACPPVVIDGLIVVVIVVSVDGAYSLIPEENQMKNI